MANRILSDFTKFNGNIPINFHYLIQSTIEKREREGEKVATRIVAIIKLVETKQFIIQGKTDTFLSDKFDENIIYLAAFAWKNNFKLKNHFVNEVPKNFRLTNNHDFWLHLLQEIELNLNLMISYENYASKMCQERV